MKAIQINEEEYAALQVLRSTGVTILEAAIIAREALRVGRGKARRAWACIEAGAEELRKREQTVTFERAVEEALEARKDRRRRTVYDFRYICKRFMKRCKGLAKRRMRSITPQECAMYLRQAFDTPSQRNKARLILSGIFSTAVKRGWCAENPVRRVEAEKVVEKRIEPLNREEIERVMNAAESYDGGSCLAATAIMLYAGVRPHETARLRWKDVRFSTSVAGASCAGAGPASVAEAPYAEAGPASVAEAPYAEAGPASVAEAPYAEATGVIVISPQHSKTGGARCVTIHPPLARILRRMQQADHERICPPNWPKRWAGLHRQAGFTAWQPDVLRHTFATHHLATFRSYTELQLEMGHRSAELLRTRYVAMEAAYQHRGSSILLA